MSIYRIGAGVIFFRSVGDMAAGVIIAIHNVQPEPKYTIHVVDSVGETTAYRVPEGDIMEVVGTSPDITIKDHINDMVAL